jgi:PKD repeat protein
MKNYYLACCFIALFSLNSFSQNEIDYPTGVSTAIYFDEIPSLKDLPTVDKQYYIDNWGRSVGDGEEHESKDAPNFANWKDDGPDPVWQKQNGWLQSPKALINNYVGQSSPYLPSDANGTVGPNHYMQTVNTTFAVYDKVGNLVAGPTAMNTLFSGVPGSSYNDGDPLILFDEQAQKWLAVEFSISGSPYYMLIAVSQTNDPTGAWWRWSFVMNGIPDYEKMGVWHDGYYMGTNYGQLTSSYDDVYVFERSAMITGAASPQMVAFHNSNKPAQAFHCIMPLDADGASAPASSPGQFITINDNAWSGSDELRIYELDVNWTTPSSSTFIMTQQIPVASFDSQFNETWGVGDIAQQGTSNLVDAQNYTLMTRGQYKNWGTSQSIVCCHTVDVDNTNHAGQRWYELEKTSQSDASWAIRQQGTYAPDAHSRFNGSVAINDNHEIAIGYSISSSSMSPNIRYTGQSASSNAAANGLMDIAESANLAQLTAQSQTSYSRWGDYSLMTIDPVDGVTFWYTTEYYSSGKKTQIMNFTIGSSVLTAQFSGVPTSVAVGSTVTFTNASYGPNPITSYNWTFEGGTPGTATGQGPHIITYNTPGIYDVSLTVGDGSSTDSEIKLNYINASYSTSGTYTAGDISTDFGFQTLPGSSTCPGSLTVNIPAGATITSVDVQYQMTAQNNGYMSEQRSELRCVSSGGTNEGIITSGSGNSTGTYSYNRTGLTIANGVTGGGNINFQLHAGRTWLGGTPNCNTTYNKVNNNTWIVTVHYTPGTPVPPVANFTANDVTPAVGQTVTFTDASTNAPTSWSWSFSPNTITYVGATNSTSQNPQVQFNNSGYYTVTLLATNSSGSDAETKTNYILAGTGGNWTGASSTDWNTANNWEVLAVPLSSDNVTIPSTTINWPTRTGNLTLGADCGNITMNGASQMTVTGDLTISSGTQLHCNANASIFIGGDWTNNGSFSPGTGTVEFYSSNVAVIDGGSKGSKAITDYTVSTFSVGMTNLTGATTGPTGDDGYGNYNIGFTFNYDGINYTQVQVCANGWMSLNLTGAGAYDNSYLFNTTQPNTTLAPWYDDLYDDGTSVVSYKTDGSSPNRVFTAEWKGVLAYYSGATARLNFQVKLFETSNIIILWTQFSS